MLHLRVVSWWLWIPSPSPAQCLCSHRFAARRGLGGCGIPRLGNYWPELAVVPTEADATPASAPKPGGAVLGAHFRFSVSLLLPVPVPKYLLPKSNLLQDDVHLRLGIHISWFSRAS